MTVLIPDGYRLERLRRDHQRKDFHSGEHAVDDWLATKAIQNQSKRLSATTVLVQDGGVIVGYYTLATGQIDFGDLPADLSKQMPRRVLPIAVLAWLGVDLRQRGKGFGRLLLAQALHDCWEAGRIFPFIAVVLDCINDAAKSFYEHWDFAELPGHSHRLFLSALKLDAMMQAD